MLGPCFCYIQAFFRFLADFRLKIPNFNFKSCWISSESYKNTVLGKGGGGGGGG